VTYVKVVMLSVQRNCWIICH